MPLAAALLSIDSFPEELLEAVLDVSLTGIKVLSPRYSSSGELDDFAPEYLNPAARRMTGLAEQPDGTARAHFPDIFTNGLFDFYRRVFETGEAGRLEVTYQADGPDHYLQVAARRSGERLVVSFNDTGYQDCSAMEAALRESKAREQQAEAERRRLHDILMQMPAQVAVHHGSDHLFELVNPRYQQKFPTRAIQGKPMHEALPGLEGQQFFGLLDHVYQTGEPFYGPEMPVQVDFTSTGRMELRYFDVFFKALHNAQGSLDGILNFSYDVTGQVLARQRAEGLNGELEARLQERTRQLGVALRQTGQHGQLAAEQSRLQRILRQVPAALATLTGPEHRYSFFNDAYQVLSGGRAAPGLTVAGVYPEVVSQGFIDLLDQVYHTGKSFIGTETPARLYNPTSGQPELRYVDFIYQALTSDTGQTTGILAFIVDVTEKVQARQRAEALQAQLLAAARHQSQEQEAFHQIFEQTPALIALLRSPGHRFEYVNPAYQRLFPDRRLVGLDLAEAVPELREQGFTGLLDQVYQTGETYFGSEQLFVVPAHDGLPACHAYFNFTYQAFRENGQIAGISIFAYEVTDQVLARLERAARQRQLGEVFEQAPVAIFVLRGAEYVLEVVNPAMGEMLGAVPGRILGRRYMEEFPGLAAQGYKDLLDGVWHSGREYVAHEQPAQLPHHRHGETGYYNFTYVPLREAEGSIAGIMCVAVDVTAQVLTRRQVQHLNQELASINGELAAANEELRASNEELAESNGQLLRTNADLDNFIYTASHDLKAPISNIEGLLGALLRTLPAESLALERVQGITGMMQDSVERFRKTIASLTEVVKLQKENSQQATEVNLPEVIREVLLDLEPVMGSTGARVDTDMEKCRTIRFPEKNLRSVIYNLISNGIKYRSPERLPRVRIECRSTADCHVLTVSDNGLGLRDSQLDKLFTMFKRFHDHVEGSGIGLYMIRKMVENAGGRIEVESRVGEGTVFTVFFPR